MFRHAAASWAMANGMGDDAVIRLFGWRTRAMLNRYGAAVADERAREAHEERVANSPQISVHLRRRVAAPPTECRPVGPLGPQDKAGAANQWSCWPVH
jgi:hypothetical protein